MFMYNQINGGVDEGAYPVDGFALLVNKGNDTRKNYFQGDWNWITAPTQQEFTNAAQYKIGAYKVLFASSVGKGGAALQASLQNALANNTPVAITIPVRDGFDRVGTGVVDDITTPSRGLHEVTVLGYDATGILIQNHWGVNWGNKGFARLSWKVVQNDVLEAIVVTTPPKFPKAAPFTRFIGAVNNLF